MLEEKYSRIIDYLLEFSKCKGEPVRNIENSKSEYPEIIWLSDLSGNYLFECITNTNYKDITDCWLKISKPKEPHPPAFPILPDALELWADKDTFKDENSVPRLKQSVFVNGKTLLSTQFPPLAQALQAYVKDKWLDDLILYKSLLDSFKKKSADFEITNKIFNRLLAIYHKIETSADEYEFVAGIGLLYFKNPVGSDLICRHILTSKAEITFDPAQNNALIEVRPDIESVIQIETDALEIEQVIDNVIEAEKVAYQFLKEKNINNALFNSNVKDALQLFAEKINSDCKFIDLLAKPVEVPLKPVIYFSPALILRKINTGGLTSLYDKIIKIINETPVEVSISSNQNIDNAETYTEPETDYYSKTEIPNSDVSTQPPEPSTQNLFKISNMPDLLSQTVFLIFTSMRNVYKVLNKGISNKYRILENIILEPGETPVYITGTRNYSGYLIVAYENGKIAKITMESYMTEFNRKKLKNAYNNESKLIFIEHIPDDIDLVAVSSINKVILFNTKLINPVGSKTTKGFQVLKSKDGSTLAKIRKPEQVKFQNPDYYRRAEGLNVVGFYLKQGDEIN